MHIQPNFIEDDIFVKAIPNQTLLAWEPFWDCVGILFQFQNSDVADGDTELTEWRIAWVAGVSLLRAIGHVLVKVDSNKSPKHAACVQCFWSYLKAERSSNYIFWEFIEKERNNILKTYSFGAKLQLDGKRAYIATDDGDDAFGRFRYAVYWWRQKLVELEASISS